MVRVLPDPGEGVKGGALARLAAEEGLDVGAGRHAGLGAEAGDLEAGGVDGGGEGLLGWGRDSAIPTASQALRQSPAPTVSRGFHLGTGTWKNPSSSQRARAAGAQRDDDAAASLLGAQGEGGLLGSVRPGVDGGLVFVGSEGVDEAVKRGRQGKGGSGVEHERDPGLAGDLGGAAHGGMGVSSWATIRRPFSNQIGGGRDVGGRDGVGGIGDDDLVLAVLLPRRMRATPEGSWSEARKCRTSMPSARRPALAARPKSSSHARR